MDSPSDRLDKAIETRRLDLDLSLNDLAAAAKISAATLRAIRRGTNQPGALTKRRIEDALKWGHGSIEAILAGGDPKPITLRHLTDGGRADESLTVTREPSVAELRAELEAQRARGNRLEERIAAIEARERDRRQEQGQDKAG
jgi:transcriptional regulator with XRE-family HTH domain